MQFMITLTFDPNRRAEVERGLPAEQARVRELQQQGVLDALYVPAADGAPDSVWVVLNGDSRQAVQDTLESLPLYPYMQAELTPLRPLNLSV
jgi:muconolactone delta-isomerase